MDILQNYCPSTLYPFFWQLFTKRNKWFMISYGSVSAGREFRLFYVTFFLKVEPPCDQTWWVIPFVQLLVVYHIFLVPKTPWLDLCGHFKVIVLKKLSGKGGYPPPLNGQNPRSSFLTASLTLESVVAIAAQRPAHSLYASTSVNQPWKYNFDVMK